MEETLLLSYHSSALYTSDPLTLREGGWLSDAILGFYFEYLAHDVLAGSQTVLFLKPALVQCLRVHTDAASHSAAVPPDIFKRELVFIPVNGTAGNPAADAHWSLLVYVRRPKPAFHYFDSMANANYSHALAVKEALVCLLKRFHRVPHTEDDPPLITHCCPQQENGSDCGIFVVLFADILTRRYADAAWHTPQATATSGTVPTAQLLPSIPSPAPSIGSLTSNSPNNSDAFLHNTTTTHGSTASLHRPPPAKRRINLEKTFWWIDYGDLRNPMQARLVLRSLVKKLCIKNNTPLI